MTKTVAGLCLTLALTLSPTALHASDHADPIVAEEPEANITGLLFFPKDDQLVLVLNVRRALTDPGPYDLEPYVYNVYMDLHSRVTYDDEAYRTRYGGTVVDPEAIRPDVTIQLHLKDDATLRESSIVGLTDPDRIRLWTGVRDDPFIFPRFFRRNVISMVLSIPIASFPEGQQDWILWGTVTRAGAADTELLDHVGRSNRTQQGRFGFLNKLPPDRHVAAIMKESETTTRIDDQLKRFNATMGLENLFHYVLQLRSYDFAPDVMIFTSRFPPGFPNGRRLTDDVAALTCATGDCVLQEVSFIEGGWPRATTNDKPFLDDFPYLAEPWPETPATPAKVWPLWPFVLAVLLLIVLLQWLLCRWCRRRAGAKDSRPRRIQLG